MKKLLLLYTCLLASLALPAQSAWAHLSTPLPSNGYGIYALDREHYIACSEWGRLFLGSDGGQQVDIYQLPGNFSIFYDISFADAQHGFAAGGCYYVTDECQENILATTEDGGQSWKWERIAEGLGAFIQLDAFPDGSVWALSDFKGLFKRDAQTGTWHQLPNPGGFVAGTYSYMQFFTPEQGFVTHYGKNSNGDYTCVLLSSNNGGLDWTTVAETPPNSFHEAPFYFKDAQNGFRMGIQGKLGRSSDGGHTWTDNTPFPSTENLILMTFADAQTAYLSTWEDATQSSRVYKSVDGGDSWSLDAALDSAMLTGFHFSNAENGYAVAGWREIYRRSGTSSTHEPAAPLVTLQPNPAEGSTLLHLPAGVEIPTLLVSDATGREILQRTLHGQSTLELQTANWPAGWYYIQFPGTLLATVRLAVK